MADQHRGALPQGGRVGGPVDQGRSDVTAPGVPTDPDSEQVRAPGKGVYRALAPSADRRLRDRDFVEVKPAPERAVPVTSSIMGDLPAGRSALDQRKASA